jgi:hypothetical protein
LAEWVALAVDQLERGEDVPGDWPDGGAAVQKLLPTVRHLLHLGNETGGRPDQTFTLGDVPLVSRVEAECDLGGYRLVREIGRGGMGVVYEAVQTDLDRVVAVKVLGAVSDERRRKRFQFEARAAAGLNHPHIVPVYAVGVDAGTLYYAMPLVRGVNLGQLIAGLKSDGRGEQPAGVGCPPPGTPDYHQFAARVIAVAADALHHAHGEGIVHRDVKPGNLLIEPTGWVWVADFGLATAAWGDELTATGDVVGTARFMSPEQTTGRRGLVDQRSDVYSLGVTLYELLTLAPAFDGRTAEVLLHIATAPPLPLRRHDPTIPRELVVVVEKAMEKNPADRYQTAAELAADLNRFARGEPILARPPTPAERFRRWSFRHRGRLAVLTAASLLLSVWSAVAWRTTDSALARERQANALAEQRLKDSHAIFESTVLTVLADDRIHDAAFEELRQRFMTKGADYLERFTRDHAEDPAFRSQMACAVEQLGEIRHRQGRKEEAASLFRDAVLRYDLLIAQTDGPLRVAYLERRAALGDRLKQAETSTHPALGK